MPNPKHRHSKSRRDKRRANYKAAAPTVGTDAASGQPHLLLRAHWHEDKLYYKGKVVQERES
jgi:large subunit ribosomal protein L32